MGKLIVIEGACDGIGKTTQFNMLKERLEKDNIEIYYHHFPSYNTYQGTPVEKYLNGEYGNIEDLSPYFINSLYANDRVITWNTVLKHEYNNNKIILLDRYTTSSLIYQSCELDSIEEKKKFIDYVIDFEYNKLELKQPDQVIFLTAPLDLVTNLRKERQNNQGIINDIHERNIEFMNKVYNNALFVADYLKWDKVECSSGSKFRTIEDIHDEIYTLIKANNNL